MLSFPTRVAHIKIRSHRKARENMNDFSIFSQKTQETIAFYRYKLSKIELHPAFLHSILGRY